MVMFGDISQSKMQYQMASNEQQTSNGHKLGDKVTKSNIMISTENRTNENGQHTNNNSDSSDDDRRIKFEDWGFNIDRLFEVAYRFYKRNESKAFHPSFDERNQMNALIMQAKYGNHDIGKDPDIGVLDLVGKRRQHEWSLLKGMSKTEAMTKFICTLDEICPIFKAHAEAVKISSGVDRIPNVSIQSDGGVNEILSHQKGSKIDVELQSIHSSLCKQTYSQFKNYAEKQHPNDLAQQKSLISSLQEQYYQQYISQMQPELKLGLHNSNQDSGNQDNSNIPSSMPSPTTSEMSTATTNEANLGSGNNITGLSDESYQMHTELFVKQNQDSSQALNANNKLANKNSGDQRKVSIGNQTNYNETRDIHKDDAENHFEADISCEELISDTPAKVLTGVASMASTKDKFTDNLPVEQLTEKIVVPNVMPNKESVIIAPQEPIVEPVKLYQKTEKGMSQIGMFESFPEPKLVQKPALKSTPIDLMNPNFPTLPPLPPEIKNIAPTGSPHEKSKKENYVETVHQGDLNNELKSNHLPAPPTTLPHTQDTTYISMHSISQNESNERLPETTIPEQQPSKPHHFYQGLNLSNGQELPLEQLPEQRHTSASLQEDPVSITHQRIEPPELWGDTETDELTENQQANISYEPLEPATIWSRGAVAEFKDSLGGDKQGGVYEIKEGALVVIQVPTYPNGRYIYFEFATDDYDIGFGVDFVHERNLNQPLALNIYEDNDDDDLEDLIDGDGWSQPEASRDVEYGSDPQSGQTWNERDKLIAEKRRRLGNTVSVIPTYRRDSHEEVFVGRHKYPGQGYYLLRFDNTYSVLRSKTLYFRICYFI